MIIVGVENYLCNNCQLLKLNISIWLSKHHARNTLIYGVSKKKLSFFIKSIFRLCEKQHISCTSNCLCSYQFLKKKKM
jgi:hypothetical protein